MYPTASKLVKLPYRSANLDKKPPHRLAVIHGIKRRNLVNTHGRHLKQSRHLVHNADTRVAVLALTQIQHRHHGGLLVLWGIALEDLIDDLEVLLGELEGEGGVILGGIAVLDGNGVNTWVLFPGIRRETYHGESRAVALRASRERPALLLRDGV